MSLKDVRYVDFSLVKSSLDPVCQVGVSHDPCGISAYYVPVEITSGYTDKHGTLISIGDLFTLNIRESEGRWLVEDNRDDRIIKDDFDSYRTAFAWIINSLMEKRE